LKKCSKKDVSKILGALCDALSAALRYHNDEACKFLEEITPKLETLTPRMLNVIRWVTAAEIGGALPWKPGEFLKAYVLNRMETARDVLNNSVARVVIKFMEGRSYWEGTTSDLLKALFKEIDKSEEPIAMTIKNFPKDPRVLGKILHRIAPELRRVAGIDVEHKKQTGGTRLVVLRLVDKEVGGMPAISRAFRATGKVTRRRGVLWWKLLQNPVG